MRTGVTVLAEKAALSTSVTARIGTTLGIGRARCGDVAAGGTSVNHINRVVPLVILKTCNSGIISLA